MKLGIVIPTNRPERVIGGWWDAWAFRDVAVYLVHDAPEPYPALLNLAAWHLSWQDIARWFPEEPDLITQRSDAVRCIGLLEAYHDGCEIVITLDDDVTPNTPDFLETVERLLLEGHPHDAWLNPAPNAHARGVPFRHRERRWPVAAVACLPSGDADLSAVWRLAHGETETALPDVGVVPPGQYMPLSSLCLAVTREFLPLWYFPPQGQNFDRWGDIWAGLLIVRVAEHLRRAILWTSGNVHHECASDPFVGLMTEARGYARNERFWDQLDALALTGSTPLDCACEIADWMQCLPDSYLRTWGRNLARWVTALDNPQRSLLSCT